MWSYSHHVRDTRDVNEHAQSLSQWDQQYEQISGGRFQGRIEDLSIGPAQLFREHTCQAVLQSGLSRPGTVTLAVPVRAVADSVFCGRRLALGQGFAVMLDNEFELVTHGEFDIVALAVDLDFLSGYARRIEGIELHQPPLRSGALSGGEESNASLRELVLTVLRTVSEADTLLAHEPMRRVLVHAACDALLARLRGPCPERPLACVTSSTRQRIVREAREYMRRHAAEPLGVPDLCEALQVSRRTLQYSFHDVLQLSPVTYLRVLRLNGVRRALREGGREPVADCAARWGFWHLSRMATDYRALFGELPSQTLQRAREQRPAAH